MRVEASVVWCSDGSVISPRGWDYAGRPVYAPEGVDLRPWVELALASGCFSVGDATVRRSGSDWYAHGGYGSGAWTRRVVDPVGYVLGWGRAAVDAALAEAGVHVGLGSPG